MREWKSLVQTNRERKGEDVIIDFKLLNLRHLNEDNRPTVRALFDYSTGDCYQLKLETKNTTIELYYLEVELVEHFVKEYGTKLHSSEPKARDGNA